MVSGTTHIKEIKDRGIILSRKLVREDDILLNILTQHFGRITVYAYKAAVSKRRFLNCCEIFRHVHFYIKRTKMDFWALQEMTTLNYFKNITKYYRSYLVASRAVTLIKKMAPLDHPAKPLYTLLGGYLEFLTETETPELSWPAFEIKVLQEGGIFSMHLVQKIQSELGLNLSPQDFSVVERFFKSKNQRWVFSQPKEMVSVLQKLEIILMRVREDYNLMSGVRHPQGN